MVAYYEHCKTKYMSLGTDFEDLKREKLAVFKQSVKQTFKLISRRFAFDQYKPQFKRILNILM
jgi:hypothetical protein